MENLQRNETKCLLESSLLHESSSGNFLLSLEEDKDPAASSLSLADFPTNQQHSPSDAKHLYAEPSTIVSSALGEDFYVDDFAGLGGVPLGDDLMDIGMGAVPAIASYCNNDDDDLRSQIIRSSVKSQGGFAHSLDEKKKRRKESNRFSQIKCRKKKKEASLKLEQENKDLRSEIEQQTARVLQLEQENQNLRTQKILHEDVINHLTGRLFQLQSDLELLLQ